MAPELDKTDDAFPQHMFDALDVPPLPFDERIGGSVLVFEKRPENGPITVMTAGVSRIPTDSGERIELAVEVLDGQQGAALIALRFVCDDIARTRRVPPVASPWRNDQPFLNGTEISALLLSGSRWGSRLDDIRGQDGTVLGHVRTVRLLTDAEASFAGRQGWDALVAQAGSVDALLDVERTSSIDDASAREGDFLGRPVFITKLHAEHPPRWVTFRRGAFESVTGLESDAYMEDSANHEVWATGSYIERFPWLETFLRAAQPGQTALFTDDSGRYTLEDD